MSKKAKALSKLRQNPKHVRFEEIEKILLGLASKSGKMAQVTPCLCLANILSTFPSESLL
jgi:hypothetical protein